MKHHTTNGIRIVNRRWNIAIWALINILMLAWAIMQMQGMEILLWMIFSLLLTAFLPFLGSWLITLLSILALYILWGASLIWTDATCEGIGCIAIGYGVLAAGVVGGATWLGILLTGSL